MKPELVTEGFRPHLDDISDEEFAKLQRKCELAYRRWERLNEAFRLQTGRDYVPVPWLCRRQAV